MSSGATELGSRPSPGGVRSLASLRVEDAEQLGEEAADLARLAHAGVPLGEAFVISLLGDDAAGGVAAVVAPAVGPGREVRLEPWFVTRSVALRAGPRWPALVPIATGAEVEPRVRELFEAVRSSSMAGA